jgi:hypothetical protein
VPVAKQQIHITINPNIIYSSTPLLFLFFHFKSPTTNLSGMAQLWMGAHMAVGRAHIAVVRAHIMIVSSIYRYQMTSEWLKNCAEEIIPKGSAFTSA